MREPTAFASPRSESVAAGSDSISAPCHVRLPDLVTLRALAEYAELADAVSVLTDGDRGRLAATAQLSPLARKLAWAPIEAGLAVHRCSGWDPLHRLGRVCLRPVAAAQGHDGPGGVAVSWIPHGLLSLDEERTDACRVTCETTNGAAVCYALRRLPFRWS